MSSVRALLIAALEAELPGVDVLPAGKIDALERDRVLVRIDTVEPNAQVPRARDYVGTVLAVSPLADDDTAVEDLREDVLAAVDRAAGFLWTKAERVTVDDLWPAYEISIRFPIKFEP